MACREPEVLERYFTGKQWQGVTVAMVAESFLPPMKTAFSAEIKRD